MRQLKINLPESDEINRYFRTARITYNEQLKINPSESDGINGHFRTARSNLQRAIENKSDGF